MWFAFWRMRLESCHISTFSIRISWHANYSLICNCIQISFLYFLFWLQGTKFLTLWIQMKLIQVSTRHVQHSLQLWNKYMLNQYTFLYSKYIRIQIAVLYIVLTICYISILISSIKSIKTVGYWQAGNDIFPCPSSYWNI